MLVQFYKFINHLKSSPARKNRLLQISTIIGILLNLSIWALILIKFKPFADTLSEDQTFIPLHYNIYLGIDHFGPWQRIFNLPIIGLIILILNTILAIFTYNRKEVISYFLTFSSVFIQLIFIIATVLTILINI